MNQQWPPDDVEPPAEVKHQVRVTRTHHWRKGTQFYAQCDCTWKGHKYSVRLNAERSADGHARRTGGVFNEEVNRG